MFLSIRFIKRFLGFIQSWAQIALAQNAQNIIFARNFFKCRYLDICVVFICSNSRSYYRDQISKIQNIEEVVHLSISGLNQSRFSDHQHSKQIKSEVSGLLVSIYRCFNSVFVMGEFWGTPVLNKDFYVTVLWTQLGISQNTTQENRERRIKLI